LFDEIAVRAVVLRHADFYLWICSKAFPNIHIYPWMPPRKAIGLFLNNSGFSLYQPFIVCKGVLLPKADCGSCWL